MSSLEFWLYFLLVSACVGGAYLVWRVKELKKLFKFMISVTLIAVAVMLFCEAIFEIWQSQLARGF